MLPQFLSRRAQLPVDRAAVDLLAVPVERPLPYRCGVLVAAQLEQEVAVVILDRRIAAAPRRGLRQVLLSQIEFVLPEVGPPEAVEVGGVVRLRRQRRA